VNDRILTVADVARYLQVHDSTIYRMLKKGTIPGFRVASEWRFSMMEIDKWRQGLEAAMQK
jgi:excisionase family DNA binding protein